MTFDRLPDDQSYRNDEVEVFRPMVHRLQKELAAVKRERGQLRKQVDKLADQVERLGQENRDLMSKAVQVTDREAKNRLTPRLSQCLGEIEGAKRAD